MASPSVEDRLWTVVSRLEQIALKLPETRALVESLALESIRRLRKQLAKAYKELQLANKDRRMLRKELIMLHTLLNEQVKDMQPKLKKGPKTE